MGKTVRRTLIPAPLNRVEIADRFWAPRLRKNRTVTLPHIYRQYARKGRRIGHTWIEGAACSLAAHPNRGLEKQLDDAVAYWTEQAQQKDGCLNPAREPENRWTNMRDGHELYGIGHLVESAVAYCETTGKRTLLDVVCRYTDYIASIFGPARGQIRGYCGHPEIELALVKLYRATGETRYLKLAEYFVNERGRKPLYFDIEAKARGKEPRSGWYDENDYQYYQAHLPVREQKTAEGHAVRAMYLYCGMADVAVETGEASLIAACRRLWKNVINSRMYITGGVGSATFGESFTFDYDLPNESAYAETCATIGLVFWSHRMLEIEDDGQYADVMERALYNGVLSGISLDGKKFFYSNPLSVYPHSRYGETDRPEPGFHALPDYLSPTRRAWFACACCPPNIARLLASFGQYVYSQNERQVSVHLYARGSARLAVGGRNVIITQDTDYPWQETVRITVQPEDTGEFTLALRIPGWCRGASLKINGRPARVARLLRKGYARIRRVWAPGDVVDLTLPMPVERVEAHPLVRMNAGLVALQRGPVVYCLEEVDNGPNLSDICLPRSAVLRARFDEKFLNGAVVIEGKGLRRDPSGWANALYKADRSGCATARITAVPYSLWCNRKPGEMAVWIREI